MWNSIRETKICAREKFYKMCPWKFKIVREKTSFILRNLPLDSISQGVEKTVLPLGWKKFTFYQKNANPGGKRNFFLWNHFFYLWKKKQKSAREKNKWAWKNGKKCAWKRFSACEKKRQKCQKGFSRALFIFTGKKIHTRNFKIANNPQKLHVKFCEILV